MEKYCDECEKVMRLTEDGYCRSCGKHADNMRSRIKAFNAPCTHNNYGLLKSYCTVILVCHDFVCNVCRKTWTEDDGY